MPRMRMFLCAIDRAILSPLYLLLFLLCVGAQEGQAQPSKSNRDRGWIELSKQSIAIQIQAATRVEMQVQRNPAGRPEITGQLLDDQGKGIPRAPLVLQLPDKREIPLQTNEQGRFRKEVKDFPPKGVFALRFPGRSGFRKSQIRRDLDLGRVDATFSAVFPPELPSGTKRFVILATLRYQDTPLPDYPLQLFLGRLEKEKPHTSEIPLLLPKETPPRTCKDLGVAVMTLKTDAKGRLRFVWQGSPLEGPAKIPLCLMFQGDRYFLPQDRRHALQIVAPPPKPPQTPWLWVSAFSALALAFGAVVLLRRKFKNSAPPQAQPLAAEELLRSHDNEQIIAQRGIRPPQDRVFAGRLIDLYEQKPVPNARLFLQQDDHETEVAHSRPDGSFHWQAPDDLVGPVVLWIRHSAFREKSIHASCPHYGEARSLQIGLYSYRYLCLEAFRQGVESLKRPFNPRKQTAREIIALLPQHTAHLLRPLAIGFEHAYYAPAHPSKELYQHVATALKGLLQQDSSLLPAISLFPNHAEHERLAAQIDVIPLKPLSPPTSSPPPASPPSLQAHTLSSSPRPTLPPPVSLVENPPVTGSREPLSLVGAWGQSPHPTAPSISFFSTAQVLETPQPSLYAISSEDPKKPDQVSAPFSEAIETTASAPLSEAIETTASAPLSDKIETTASAPLSDKIETTASAPLSDKIETTASAPREKLASSHTMDLLEEEVASVRAAAAAFEELQRRDRAHHTLQLSPAERDAFFAALLATSPESALSLGEESVRPFEQQSVRSVEQESVDPSEQHGLLSETNTTDPSQGSHHEGEGK
ncbi:hypothetical protein L6R29_11910 [Myxococcota bacterium]|nr:hypothetical protein [Myxococcota bacterium]